MILKQHLMLINEKENIIRVYRITCLLCSSQSECWFAGLRVCGFAGFPRITGRKVECCMLTCCRLALPNDLMTHGGRLRKENCCFCSYLPLSRDFFFFFFYCFLCHSPPKNHGYTFFMVIS